MKAASWRLMSGQGKVWDGRSRGKGAKGAKGASLSSLAPLPF
jgi:hypothetical protein